MKVRQLICVACATLLALPLFANAEVYKWKDKDGSVRYSDTPPPSNIKLESIGRKKVSSTGKEPLAPVTDSAKAPVAVAAPAKDATNKGDDAAKIRQKNAELEKKNKEVKEADAKQKAENCSAAKGNLETYKQGGRISKVNEKGEKVYLDDKAINEGKEKSQQEVNDYCN